MSFEQSVVCPVLIGRAAPMTTVIHTLDRARDGHGGTLLVSGEAGIGKSRLVRTMAETARGSGFVTLHGACFEADRARPYAPVLDLVRMLAATGSPALARHYFAPAGAELVTLFPELRAIFPELTPRAASDPEEDRRRLFFALGEAVRALGRVQPLVMTIDDVHWSDDATLDLLLYLARSIASQPIALVLTFRSDEVSTRLGRLLADFDRARLTSELALRPLEPTEVAGMLSAIFGAESTFDASFVARLHGLTEGNPFFVEEVLKALVVDGDLVEVEGRWRARPLEHVRVPRTATEAVGRRLAGLSERAREVISVAAVAGRRFDFELLAALTTHREPDLLALVKELVAAQLVVEESADRFAFRHALTREAIRTRLLTRERVTLHRAIATVLERTDTGMHDVEDALAYHTFEAGDWEAARQHALAAAARALSLGAAHEALQQFDRAVTATTKLGQRPDPFLLVSRGQARETLGLFTAAQDDFTTALGRARADGDLRAEWAALHSLGLLWAARDYERAGSYRHEALGVARAIGDSLLVARSLNRVGNWYINREDPRSGIPYHDEALTMFERLDDRRGVAETVDLLAMANHLAGAQDAAVPLYDRSVELFTALDDRRGLANALSVVLVCGPSHHASAGPVSTSVHTGELLASERAIRLASEIGWRAGEAFSRYLLADCLAWRGDLARALRHARESLAIAEEMEHLEWQCGARRVLGTIALHLHALPDALTHLESAYDIALRLGSATWSRWTAGPFAIALARAGRADRAAVVLDEVDRIVRGPAAPHGRSRETAPSTLGERHLTLARAEVALAVGVPRDALSMLYEPEATRTPRAALLRAQASAALEQWDDAMTWLSGARAEARAQEARPLYWQIDAAEGAVHLAQRNRLEARRSFNAARAAAIDLVALLDEPALVTPFRARVDTVAPPAAERTQRQKAKAAHGGLTRRERDTAALVAHGKSNRSIARSLGIGERTVESYVAAALSKLGFTSRSQLAVWAVAQGLAGTDPGGRTRGPRH